MGRAGVALWSMAVSAGVGCGSATSGTLVLEGDDAKAVTVAEVTTFERDGLRVLWNGQVERGSVGELEGFVAGDREELERLWEASGMARQSPRVDFSREVVFAFAAPGGVCPRELTHASLEKDGVLRISGPPWGGACVDLLTRVATVVAVPRRLLGEHEKVTVVWSEPQSAGFEFSVPCAPAAETSSSALPTDVALRDEAASLKTMPLQSVPLQAASSGATPLEPIWLEATLPARGHMALTRLANGMEVWVVHHHDGSLDVLSAAVTTRGANFFLQRVERDDALYVAPTWLRESGRFSGGYDARGQNVHGWEPMQRHRYVRSSDDRVRVSGASNVAPLQPILPPETAPILDGPATAYEHDQRRVFTEFGAIPLGNVELLAIDVVWGLSGQPRLCRAPASTSSETFAGCAASAPIVAGSIASEHSAVLVLEGPVLVRKRGPRLAEVIVTGRPSARVIGPTL